jgi:hypothetical protein
MLLLAAAPAAPGPFGVAKAVAQDCPKSASSEIVVCGSREPARLYRLPKLPGDYAATKPFVAATTVGGLPMRAHVDPVELPGGAKSNRIMLTVSTKF